MRVEGSLRAYRENKFVAHSGRLSVSFKKMLKMFQIRFVRYTIRSVNTRVN